MKCSSVKNTLIFTFSFLLFTSSCSIHKKIAKQAADTVLKDSAIATGNIGICIYEPATSKYWYNYNSTHYFIPASNTKLFTLYAGMKYLGDSLVGLRYETPNKDYTVFSGTGDPTFLHPDFKNQRVFSFLKQAQNPSFLSDGYIPAFSALGKGWAWDDYQSDYAAERSELPIYGNVASFYLQSDSVAVSPYSFYNYSIQWFNGVLRNGVNPNFKITRPFDNNSFHAVSQSSSKFSGQQVPFKIISNSSLPNQNPVFIKLLEDTLHIKLGSAGSLDGKFIPKYIIHSQHTDSLFKPMMHRSDNFFAEQTLLMVSNEKLGYMSDEKIIDSLLNTDLKDVPQRPKWVDGSGLSRYNLFTPQSFVYILNKMRTVFKFERLKVILPTGGEGTLSNYFKTISGNIYAKTGTLSNNCALSGYLITNKGKLLIFSVLANNYITGATPVRRAVEQFLEGIQKKY
jgi:D-alanyl-D-alanine carboxypeptidase/D-alanyl-D-alanine-endopeptidase (penicillin-binding protein 4)